VGFAALGRIAQEAHQRDSTEGRASDGGQRAKTSVARRGPAYRAPIVG